MSPDLPWVSIVTPSFNSGPFLEQAILSVINQAYPHLEHIVIDGASTDDTLEILHRYGSQVTWISEPDEGQADALNKGFQRARGEIIGWLNADDTYQPQAIQSAVTYLLANPEADLVYSNFNFIDESGRIIYTHCTPRFSLEKLLYGNIIPNAGMFFRRDVLDEIGGLNRDLHYVLDWEFVLRVALRYRVCQVPAVWGNFRMTPGTKSVKSPDHFWPEIIPVLQAVLTAGADELRSHRARALFWAHLLGAVEFARANRLALTKEYLEEALSYKMPTVEEAAALAFVIIETATRPWHRGFRESPAAGQAILNLAACLDHRPLPKRLKAHLYLYQGLAEGKNLRWGRCNTHLTEALAIVTIRKLLRPPVLRLLLYLVTGTSLLLKLRSLKNRLIIRFERLGIGGGFTRMNTD